MAHHKRRATDGGGDGGVSSELRNPATAPRHEDQRVPVFKKVSAPIITLTSREALVDWRTRRRKYEMLMQRHGNQRDMYSVKESFDHDVLESLLRYKLSMTYEACTDDHLIQWIDAKIGTSFDSGHAAVIRTAFAQLRMDVRERDPETRVLKFSREYDLAEERHRLQAYMDLNPKERTRIICAALEPESLRYRVEDAIKGEMPEAKKDRSALYQLIKAKTLLFNEVYLANMAARPRDRNPHDSKHHRNRSEGHNQPPEGVTASHHQ